MKNYITIILLFLISIQLYAQIDAPLENWSFTTGGDVNQSAAAISQDGSTIYVGSVDDSLYAINSSSGAKEWAYYMRGDVESSPVVGDDGSIYVGAQTNFFYALNSDGSLKWEYDITINDGLGGAHDFLFSSAAIGSDGTIYVGARNDTIYAFNPIDGSTKWKFKCQDQVRGTAAIGPDGTLYVASNDDNVYAIDPTNGSQKWATSINGNDEGGIAIGNDGTIYIGSSDDNLYSINPATGSINWSFETPGGDVLASPAIGEDGTIYVGSRNDSLYAVNTDGSEKWRFFAGDQVRSTAAIDNNGIIYFGSYDDKVYGLRDDITQATQVFEFTTGGNVWSPITIASNGTLFFGSSDDKVYSVTPTNSSSLANTGWPKRGRDNQHTSRADKTPIVWNGSFDSEWTNDENWDGTIIPTSIDNISIPDVANDPEIDTDVAINNIAIAPGATVTISSGASLAIMGNASGLGEVIVKRKTTGSGGYSILGAPVGGVLLADLSADYLYGYDETNATFMTPTGDMVSGVGYFVGYDAASPTVSFTGSPVSGTVTTPLSFDGSGFNLIANPYASAISMSMFRASNSTDTDGAIYLWDDGGTNEGLVRGGDYITVNDIGAVSTVDLAGTGIKGEGPAGNGFITSAQGFFVLATDAGTATFSADMQSTTTGANADANHYREIDNKQLIRLAVSGNGLYNEILVGLTENATFEKDHGLDALKFSGNELISFYSMQADDKFAIQALPSLTSEVMEVQLGMDLAEVGEYTLSLQGLEGFNEDVSVMILDNLTGELYDLNETSEISFTNSESVFTSKRFELVLSTSAVLGFDALDVKTDLIVFANEQGLNIKTKEAFNNAEVKIYSLSGSIMASFNKVDFSEKQSVIAFDKKGLFVVAIQSENGLMIKKFLN